MAKDCKQLTLYPQAVRHQSRLTVLKSDEALCLAHRKGEQQGGNISAVEPLCIPRHWGSSAPLEKTPRGPSDHSPACVLCAPRANAGTCPEPLTQKLQTTCPPTEEYVITLWNSHIGTPSSWVNLTKTIMSENTEIPTYRGIHTV